METRKSDFKVSPTNRDLRSERRAAMNELRKDNRAQVLRRKRRTQSENANHEITISQVKVASENLVKDKKTQIVNLKMLRNAFTQGSALVDAFLEVNNSMQTLIGCLSGSDSEVQLLVIWCLTNMAASTEDHAEEVLKHAGSYLTTFLSSPSTLIQDQSAWTIGNIASSSTHSSMLLQYGVLPSLLPLLQSSCVKVIKSATFALSNIARNDDAKKKLLELGVVESLWKVMDASADDDDLMSECMWVFTYLTACKESGKVLLEKGLVDRLLQNFIPHATASTLNVQLLTPVARCLGNLVCELDEATLKQCVSKQVECAAELSEDISDDVPPKVEKDLYDGIKKLLTSTVVHLNKEALWLLSNLAVFKSQCELLVLKGLHLAVINLLSSVYNVAFEAVCCLGNLCSHGEVMCVKVYEGGCLQKLVPLLHSHDLTLIHASLSLLQSILAATNEKGAQTFEENKGLTALEKLEYHQNQNIATKTNEILEKQLYVYQK